MRFASAGLVVTALLLSSCAKKEQASTTPPLPISSAPPVRAASDPPGAAILVGTYQETADGPLFVHCATQAPYPIAREGALDTLAREYAAVPHESGAPLVVSLVGRLRPLPEAEGVPPRDELIVDRLLRVWPEETCVKAGVQTSLDNTYWKLVELNGAAVAPREGQREIHLLLRRDGNRVGGFAGCNQLSGRYQQDGTRLRFVELGSTLVACPFLDDERAFLAALEKVTSYQSLGESLDLRDDAGSIARFRAVYLR